MTTSLDKIPRPGERVLLRTRHHWPRALAYGGLFAGTVPAAWYLGAAPVVFIARRAFAGWIYGGQV